MPVVRKYFSSNFITFEGNYYEDVDRATKLARKLRKAGFRAHAQRGSVTTDATLAQIRKVDPRSKYQAGGKGK